MCTSGTITEKAQKSQPALKSRCHLYKQGESCGGGRQWRGAHIAKLHQDSQPTQRNNKSPDCTWLAVQTKTDVTAIPGAKIQEAMTAMNTQATKQRQDKTHIQRERVNVFHGHDKVNPENMARDKECSASTPHRSKTHTIWSTRC